MIYLYILGFIVSYVLIKRLRGKKETNNTWGDVFLTVFCSLLSWATVILIILIYLIVVVKLPKPPKWL